MTCSYGDCPRTVAARGYCSKHYRRFNLYGDPSFVTKRKGRKHKLVATIPTYSGMHRRIRREYGKASQYLCVTCGTQAEHWACTGERTVTETVNGSLVGYSLNVEDYNPMCRKCHQKLDSPVGEAHYISKLTASTVMELRTKHAAGENISQLARELGVHPATAWDAILGRTWKHLEDGL